MSGQSVLGDKPLDVGRVSLSRHVLLLLLILWSDAVPAGSSSAMLASDEDNPRICFGLKRIRRLPVSVRLSVVRQPQCDLSFRPLSRPQTTGPSLT